MKRLLQTMGYLLKSIVNPTIFALVVMIIMLAILDFTNISTGRFSLAGPAKPLIIPLEFFSGGLSLLIGAAMFLTNFRVSLANGISRKTFMLANLPVAMLIAAFFAIATQVVTEVHALFWPINTYSVAMLIENPQLNNAWPLIFQFTLYLFLILAGRFITMVYYRCNKWGRGFLSLVPLVVFYFTLSAINGKNGEFYLLMSNLLLLILQPENTINFLVLGSLVMFVLTWLVIYRVPLKD